MKIDLQFPPAYEPLLNYYKKSVGFNGGPPQDYVTNLTPVRCDVPVEQIKSVTVQLESIYEATHELEKIGPFAVTPTLRSAAGGGSMPGFPTIRIRTAADMLRESCKAQALAQTRYLSDSGSHYLSWRGLKGYFPVVARLRFGEDPNRLDRTIEVRQPAEEVTAQNLSAFGAGYALEYIPYREGAKVYSRLELVDGTLGKVLETSPPPDHRRGVELKPAAGQDPSLRLFAAFEEGREAIDFTPVAPDGTAKVLYTFDEGGYFPANREWQKEPSNAAWRAGFRFQGPVSDAKVRLKFELENGNAVGPYGFTLENVRQSIAEGLKSRFVADEESALICLKLTFTYPLPTPKDVNPAVAPKDQQVELATRVFHVDHANGDLLRRIQRKVEVPDDIHAPAMVCLPRGDWLREPGDEARRFPRLGSWSAVKQVNIGTRPGRLDQVAPVAVRYDATNQYERATSKVLMQYLPDDAKGVYVQFTFRDGTTSPEIRVPIVTVTPHDIGATE